MVASLTPQAKAQETTPLLPKQISDDSLPPPIKYGKSVLYRALICGFMVSLSFGVTQVPLIYVFRLMTCEAYYTTHPDPGPSFDRCGLREIEAGTSRAVGLLGASTTLFGVLNLFVTGWTIKRFGVKAALLISVFWPAVRLAVQNVGVESGGKQGILIVQASQIITILGGPAGYLLALNSYVAEVIEAKERTGALGKLQGCAFFGTALAYLAGGLISDAFGIIAPFRVTVVLFLSSCIYVTLALPWIPPNKAEVKQATIGLGRFFGPLKIFTPQKWILKNGKAQTEYGTILLGLGVLLGVLATGYIPVLLQMYATDVFGFGTTENGYLISLNSFIRGIFLTFIFPHIINFGRKRMNKNLQARREEEDISEASTIAELPSHRNEFAAVAPMDREEEPMRPTKPHDGGETYAFDLLYSRYSLLADGILTGGAAFVTQGWHMYIVGVLLPFAAGTGASAKGSILQMCPASERTDALGAITLVEMVARLLTTSVFGLVFAAFAEIGKTYLVFTCNAAVAFLGFCVLMFSRFPPDGSRRADQSDTDEQHGSE